MAIELANKQQLPIRTHLGDRDQIAAIHSRLASMMQLPADAPGLQPRRTISNPKGSTP